MSISPACPVLPSGAISTALPNRPDLSGLWIPLITPFTDEGAVDHAALRALVRRLAPAGIAGFVACGSTGEAAALDDAEQLAVIDTVMDAAGPLPVLAGVSGHHLGATLDRVRRVSQRHPAGLLVPPPLYVRPSQAGVLQWFHAVADASARPVVVYDIPYRTGTVLALETLRALALHPNIVALKDCGGDAAKTAALLADGRLQVLAGEDAQIFSTVAAGGAGAIAASAHAHTRRFAQVVAQLRQQRLAAARALWQPLLPLVAALFAEPNPGPVKALLAHRGWVRGGLRAPMTAASPRLVAELVRLSEAIDAREATEAGSPA